MKFLSPEPEVKLTRSFDAPYKSIITAARTCYSSKGIITDEEVTHPYVNLVSDLYKAGHHTTFQHAQFQFAISNVSRHAVWSFLHSHPFYNSEQVSQRYVEVKDGNYAVPPLSEAGLKIYRDTVDKQIKAYHELRRLLFDTVAGEYFRRFPGRKSKKKYVKEIEKKAQEVARYVLPVSTFTYLYHTVSALTLLRYLRMCRLPDTPLEQSVLAGKMAAEVKKLDPDYENLLREPLEQESFPEFRLTKGELSGNAGAFRTEFDGDLDGKTSKLVDFKTRNQKSVADAVREVLGVPSSHMSDESAIALALDPAENPLLGEELNLTTHGKLTRALHHASYTFKKKISHTADSQDQRHRMTPASRPVIAAHLDETPDYITPALIEENPAAKSLYEETMSMTWTALTRLGNAGEKPEFAAYLLPNAVAVRFTESGDLLNLRHKHAMRLCYNAQEEIWKASLEEALQISEIDPGIGRFLLPPCTLRMMAGIRPVCPEGKRYCGEPVWKYDRNSYERLI